MIIKHFIYAILLTACTCSLSYSATLQNYVGSPSNDFLEVIDSKVLIDNLLLDDEADFLEAKVLLSVYDFAEKDAGLIYSALMKTYPDDDEPSFSARMLLFEALARLNDENALEFARNIYPSLPNNPSILTSCLRVLSKHADSTRLTEIFQLAQQYHNDERVDFDKVFEPIQNRKLREQLFVVLFDLADYDSYSPSVFLALHDKFISGYFELEMLIPEKDTFVDRLMRNIDKILASGKTADVPDDIDYIFLEIEIIADLAGFLPKDDKLTSILYGIMNVFPDRIALYSAISLLRLGEQIRKSDLERFAKDPLLRSLLLDHLSGLGKQELFPEEYYTQYHYAESDLINWLCHPNEFGGPPEKIELIESRVVKNSRNQTGTAYLFKYYYPDNYFGDGEKHGWMVGISGIYSPREDKIEFLDGESITFSHFNKLEEMSIKEHFNTFLEEK